jgi:2-polyprenyl-3-methyl-5-hydroxy-6-metoxy-1,4-benzoquinol methylase
MAYMYGPIYRRIWSDALMLPGGSDLWDSLSSELALYREIDHAVAKRRAQHAWTRKQALSASGMAHGEPTRYYEEQQHGIETGMYWHSLSPDSWALVSVAALHAAQRFAAGSRVLEFGHGVGSTGILFARHGFDVSLYDISEPMSRFAQWRFQRRGLTAGFLLGETALETAGQYDVIVSLDVLEHVENPLRTLECLVAHLAPAGVLVLNIAFGLDPTNPEHLIPRRLSLLNRLRGLGLQRATLDTLLVFYRVQPPGPGPLTLLADTVLAAWEDGNHSRFRPLAATVRRLRAFEPPPLMPGEG